MSPRPLLYLIGGICPWLSGCFIPYALPSYSRCPGARIPEGADEVVAVFVLAEWSHRGTAPCAAETHTFRPTVVADKQVRPLVQPHLSYGHFLYLVAIAEIDRHSEYGLTKLYRRGSKTVVLEEGQDTATVVWAPALTPEDQEAAVRDLVYRRDLKQSFNLTKDDAPPGLSPGSADPRHRQVLLFGAGEFERVANLYPPESKEQLRCRQEAANLRRRAEE